MDTKILCKFSRMITHHKALVLIIEIEMGLLKNKWLSEELLKGLKMMFKTGFLKTSKYKL